MVYKVYVDASGSGKIAIYCQTNETTSIHTVGQKLTHNEYEYIAVISAIESFAYKGDLLILSDSELVVKQLNHRYNIRDERLRKLALRAWGAMKGRNVRITWIPRKANKAGKLLG